MNSIREKIWYFICDSTTNEALSSLLVKKYQKMDLLLNVFLAISTSTSVAAWAIWKIYPQIWMVIIVLSQLIMVIKPHFLFPKYVKVFNEKSIRWQYLTAQLEEVWHNLNEGYINEKEATLQFFDLKQKSLAFNNTPDDLIFFSHKKEQKLAEERSNIYTKKL